MRDNTRLIVNTMAHNTRTVLNILMSLYSTRLVLDALGKEDYGIYMLVAGIVSLLSYLTNALIVTTQRHLSYSRGSGETRTLKQIFANSYMLHLALGIMLMIIFSSFTSAIFDNHILNISVDKISEAKLVYYTVILSVSLSLVTSPFRALLISHENIVYISIIDVLDGVLKLSLVFLLFLVENHRLPIYATIITTVMLFNLLAFMIYCRINYEETCIVPSVREWKWAIQKRLLGFATWTLYGMLCVFLRMQGVSVLLNRTYGTIINASYGIAGQILGSVTFLSQAISNAIAPQIMKAAGAKDKERMLHLSEKASKYCFFILSLVVVPLVFEMPSILKFWLGTIPNHAVLFCDIMLLMTLCDQLTYGLNITSQAIGRIRNYSLLIYTIKILTVPFVWIGLKQNYSLVVVMFPFLLFEFISAMVRIPFLVRTAGLNARLYIHNVFGRIFLPVLFMLVAGFCATSFVPNFLFRFLLTFLVTIGTGVCAIWFYGMDNSERQYARDLYRQIKNKFSK
jgi:O-antigen/teichoic acid export membrane protein